MAKSVGHFAFSFASASAFNISLTSRKRFFQKTNLRGSFLLWKRNCNLLDHISTYSTVNPVTITLSSVAPMLSSSMSKSTSHWCMVVMPTLAFSSKFSYPIISMRNICLCLTYHLPRHIKSEQWGRLFTLKLSWSPKWTYKRNYLGCSKHIVLC